MQSLPLESSRFSKAKPLASQIGVRAKTIAAWGASGKIHQFRINSRLVLYDPNEVFEFVQNTGRQSRVG